MGIQISKLYVVFFTKLISMISGTLHIQQNLQYMRKINSVEKNSDQQQNINERETKREISRLQLGLKRTTNTMDEHIKCQLVKRDRNWGKIEPEKRKGILGRVSPE
ncbi:hypothetical protein ACTXT7_009653 [Hymenolepis weldensis]